jgi:hypothetical protein
VLPSVSTTSNVNDMNINIDEEELPEMEADALAREISDVFN